MKSVVDEYNLLKKNKARKSESQQSREEIFRNKMELLFDVAHKEAEQMIRIEEDKVFLVDQRGPRQMKMAGVDREWVMREERTIEGKIQEKEILEPGRRKLKQLFSCFVFGKLWTM